MIDYKFIADNDPAGELETAFNTMKAETVGRSKGVFMVTDKMVANELGLADANAFLDAVESSEILPARAIEWLKSGGIDVNHPDTAGVLMAVNPPHVERVLEMGMEVVCKYGEGFKLGHLQNARQYRAEGKI